MFISYLLVFILAAIPLFELITVIPLAVIGGLSPIPVAILAFIGNSLTILLLILFVDKVKTWRKKRKQKRMIASEQEAATLEYEAEVETDSKKAKRARVLFDKYGLPGLAIIGPFFVGSHISAFMGMSFGSKRSLVTTWMLVSLGLWTIVTAVASSYGVSYFIPNVGEDGFITRIFQQ